MKIFSDIVTNPQNDVMFVLFLDSQTTGNAEQDTKHCAFPFASIYQKNADEILNVILPALSSLLRETYGESPENAYKNPK